MTIYFLKGDGIVKIGFSDNVAQRINALRSGLPFATEYLGYMPGGRQMEKHLHNTFAEHKHHGEWFYMVPAIASLVDALAIKEFPDAVKAGTFEALRLEEQYLAEQASQWLDEMFGEVGERNRDEWRAINIVAKGLGMAAGRVRSIWMGESGPVTAGEFFTIKAAHIILPTTRLTADAETMSPVPLTPTETPKEPEK